MNRNTEITIVVLVLVGAISIILALTFAYQAEQQFEQQYAYNQALKQMFNITE